MIRLTFILLFLFNPKPQTESQSLFSQIPDSHKNINATLKSPQSSIRKIFKRVEAGLQENSIDKFKRDLAEIVSMTISSGDHGYYSSNQAASVLNNYFSEHRLNTFQFSKILESSPVPYAVGRFIYIQKGIQKSAQIYVSLTLQDSTWVINQFNIY